MLLDIGSIAVGLIGATLALFYYRELRRWARQCQNARIVVAYNRRVQLNAPLVEWLQWANALGKDDASTGRVVYTRNKTSVAIIRPDKKKDMRSYDPDKASRVQPTENSGPGTVKVA